MAFGKSNPKLDPVALAQQQQMREQQEVQAAFQKGVTALRDFIAPSSLEFKASSLPDWHPHGPHLLHLRLPAPGFYRLAV